MHDTWIEMLCEVPDELADLLAAHLAEVSGCGVCVENIRVDAFSLDEIRHGATMGVRAYFSSKDDIPARQAEVRAFLETLALRHPGCVVSGPTIATVQSEEWSTSWRATFRPIRVGRRILVLPTWEESPALPGDIVLRLDPGMAFGTGSHETTRLCLTLLERILEERNWDSPPTVLDLGTGSGILAMAAVHLGTGRVLALDIDPEAVAVAEGNLAANGLAGRVECGTTPLEQLNGSYDIILANILAEELVRLSPHLARSLAPGGLLILSGILAEKEQLVLDGFAPSPLEHRETLHDGEWVAMLYSRRPE